MINCNKNNGLMAISLLVLLVFGGCQTEEDGPEFQPEEQVVVAPDNSGYWIVKDSSRSVGTGEVYYIDSYRWVTFPHSSQYPTRSSQVVNFVSGGRPVIYLSVSRNNKKFFERIDWFFDKDDRNVMYICRSELRSSQEAFNHYNEPNREDLVKGCRKGAPWQTLIRDLMISGDWAEEEKAPKKGLKDAFSITYDYFAGDKIVFRSNSEKFIVVGKERSGATTYARFVWHLEGPKLVGCFDVSQKSSIAAAKTAPKGHVDFNNLEKGCNGKPLSVFLRTLPFVTTGSYDWTFEHQESEVTITTSDFGGSKIEFVDDRLGYFITSKKTLQSDKKYSLYNYMTKSWDDSYYCLVASDLNSVDASIQTDTSKINRRDLLKGCNGKPWVHLKRKQSFSALKGYWTYRITSSPTALQPGVADYVGDRWFGQEIIKYDEGKKVFITTRRESGRLLYSGYKYDFKNVAEVKDYFKKELKVTPFATKSPNLGHVLNTSPDPSAIQDLLYPSTPFDGTYFDPSFPVAYGYETRTLVLDSLKQEMSIGSIGYVFESKVQGSDGTYILANTGKHYVIHFQWPSRSREKLYYCFVSKNGVKRYEEPKKGFNTLNDAQTAAQKANFQVDRLDQGCNGKPWRTLNSLPVVGRWFDEANFSAQATNISPQSWGVDRIVYLDVSKKTKKVVLQQLESSYKVVFFTNISKNENGLDRFYYCAQDKKYTSFLNAKNYQGDTEVKIDDLAKGCYGQSWTVLTESAW